VENLSWLWEDVMMEGQRDRILLALKMEEGATSQEMGIASRS